MEYITLLRANIKKQKGSFIGTFILFLLISMSVGTVFTIWINSEGYVKSESQRIGYGDMTCWLYDSEHLYDIVDQLNANEHVKKATLTEGIIGGFIINDGEVSDEIFLPYTGDNLKYNTLDNHFNQTDRKQELKGEEILVSPAITALYHCEIGDTIQIKITEDKYLEYKIAGYFEDPIMGGALMGLKTVLLSEEGYDKLSVAIRDEGEEKLQSRNIGMIHLYAEDKNMSMNEWMNILGEETDLNEYTKFAYSGQAMTGYMMILINIFAGFLLAFIVILLIVAVIVIGHSISTTIEQEYVDLGILKALGFTGKTLKMIQMYQYLISVLLGMVIGIPLSKPIGSYVSKMLVTTTGIIVPNKLPIVEILAVMSIIILFTLFVIYVKTRKIDKNTPIRAIRKGMEDIHFESRLTVPVYKKGLNGWLALRQIVSEKKQYIGAFIITALLVFFLSMVGRLGAWIENDGIRNCFQTAYSDIYIVQSNYDESSISTEQMNAEAREIIEKYTEITGEFRIVMGHMKLNNVDYVYNAISEPERLNLLKGRYCNYNNEILITEFMEEDLKVSIGDTVTVSMGDSSAEYVVSGIYECANDLGLNFAMSQEGLERIVQKDSICYTNSYVFKDNSESEQIIKELKEHFGEKVDIGVDEWYGAEVIDEGADSLSMLMYIMAMIFIIVVVVLASGRIIRKEKHDMGIYKAFGYTSTRLRYMFALRFGVISLAGSVIGSILSVLLNDILVGRVLKMAGVSRFSTSLSIMGMVVPSLIVVMTFIAFAYISSRKIKRVDLGQLIVE